MKQGFDLIHPGELLKEEILDAHELSGTEAAIALGVTRVALSNIVNAKAGISPQMALRISAVFGGSAEFWTRMQADYDLEKALPSFKKLHLKPFVPIQKANI